jgi:Sulfotransferase family
MSPVFIFGTGRCGSTHLQRLISMRTRHWIWGEHDGALEPLLTSMRYYEHSAKLEEFVFSEDFGEDDKLIEKMASGSQQLSWANRLNRNTFRSEIIRMIDEVFGSRLPQGWSAWGFKEIRYGHSDDVPRLLMELFPSSRAIFSFRDPAGTFCSMVQAWSPRLLEEPLQEAKLRGVYSGHVRRWLATVRYFLPLKPALNDRLIFVAAENMPGSEAAILKTMRLERRSDLFSAMPLGRTNSHRRSPPSAANAFLDQLFSEVESECRELYEQALQVCRDDLKVADAASAEGAPD